MQIFLTALVALVVFMAAVYLYNFLTYKALIKNVSQTNRHPEHGIIKGAEPIELRAGTKKAALLIHGFIGSPADYGRLPQLLHEQGYSVFVPLLPGHGTDPRNFSKVSARELEEFVLEEYRRLRSQFEEIVLIGFSMGGALAILTAVREKVDRLILLAPYLKIAHQWYYILPAEWHNKIFLNLIPYTYRPYYFKQINNKEAIHNVIDYDFVPLKGAESCIALGNKAMRFAPQIDAPTLILHGEQDRATDYYESVRLVRALEAKKGCKFVSLPRTNHMVMWDFDEQKAAGEILEFSRF